MRHKLIAIGIPATMATAALLLLAAWLAVGVRAPEMKQRAPGMDQAARAQEAAVALAGEFRAGDGLPAALAGAWPNFRGERLDNTSVDPTPLARSWGSGGPRLLWSAAMGQGYAGAAVRNGRVYVLDYDEERKADALRCLSLADGREIWRRSYAVVTKGNHGISRTVCAATDRYVVALGPKCHVICVDAVTGDFRWGIDLVAQYGTTVPAWYAGQCPLIDEGRAILAPGGRALLMAVDCETGKVLWETPNPHNWKMTHASIVPMTFAGKRMYVYPAGGGVVGVSAEDGTVLWETTDWTVKIANIPTPVPVGDGKIFFTGGYGSGSLMLQLQETGGAITARTLFRLKPSVFGSDQQTPIFYEGYLYGVIPGGELVCLDLRGKQVWRSGGAHRFGLGPYVLADGMLYLMNDTGTLTLVEASPRGYRQLAQAKILDGPDAWGPMAIVGDRLIARDFTRMVCVDIGR